MRKFFFSNPKPDDGISKQEEMIAAITARYIALGVPKSDIIDAIEITSEIIKKSIELSVVTSYNTRQIVEIFINTVFDIVYKDRQLYEGKNTTFTGILKSFCNSEGINKYVKE